MIDLHMHSTCSDGSDAPATLPALGAQIKLRAMALTDHDTLSGVSEFLDACRRHRITGFSGIELSVEVSSGTLHMLGYGMDPAHAALKSGLEQVLQGRVTRNTQILERLHALNLPVSWDEVTACAGGDVVGRLHFARALVARRYVADVHEAFDKYLAKGKPAYVNRFRLTPEFGIRLIRDAGGVPVLAHPFTWEPNAELLEIKLVEMRDFGLWGIEAYYPEHDGERTMACLRMAKKLGLAITGGTDYHGIAKQGLKLGTALGGFSVPDELLPSLLAAIPSRAGVVEGRV